ncbi:MerR family DNA-binding transcriptional regulator [Paenibacillus dakarensis]|uniref:MerR family DNA-binding transcriptional regulator n=1 Tax=Paenibacillus dakarensis TaxID=1527293 RepID=UPI0006D56667|nr:MerR family DNA-binding transcriptional regulator [Paenibacillus dakarensis]
MKMRPKKMAATFMISPSTLRNYEANGLIPPAGRSANGYRFYTDLHAAYLACIQAMAPAFGMEVTTEVLHYLQRDKMHNALWVIREKEVILYEDKVKLEKLIGDIRLLVKENTFPNAKERLTIKEVSEAMKIPKSTIRYWEHAGYVVADRDPENSYRFYNEGHLLKVGLLQVMQNFVYSEESVKYKRLIAAAEHGDLKCVMKLAENIRTHLDKRIESQVFGVSRLHHLMQLIKTPI